MLFLGGEGQSERGHLVVPSSMEGPSQNCIFSPFFLPFCGTTGTEKGLGTQEGRKRRGSSFLLTSYKVTEEISSVNHPSLQSKQLFKMGKGKR